jgi:alpha-ketoglutarate-dependent taurine dioxygenase
MYLLLEWGFHEQIEKYIVESSLEENEVLLFKGFWHLDQANFEASFFALNVCEKGCVMISTII